MRKRRHIQDFELSSHLVPISSVPVFPHLLSVCWFFALQVNGNIACVQKPHTEILFLSRGDSLEVLKEARHERLLQAFIPTPHNVFYTTSSLRSCLWTVNYRRHYRPHN